jgi:hypothetical protein
MVKHAFAAVVLSLGAATPGFAERLIFEGSFTSYMECGITGRHECSETLPIDLPFRFTVDVPSGVVNRPNVWLEQSTTYAPPAFTPSIVTDGIIGSAEGFESLLDRERVVVTSYFTSPVPSGLRWTFSIGQQWSGVQPTGGIPNVVTSFEDLSVSLSADLGRQGLEPATFAELVQLFDHAVSSRTDISVSANTHSVSSEQFNPTGASESSKSVNGVFRLVAVQCRTPVGLLSRAREMLRS